MKNLFKKIMDMNKTPLLMWMLFFGVILAAYIQFLNPYITCDHMGMALFQIVPEVPGWDEVKTLLSGGRLGNIVLLWIYYILGQINVTHYNHIFVIQLLGTLFYACSANVIYGMFKRFFNDKVQRILLCSFIILCFVNPFMVETYLYGSLDWGFGILCAVMAAKWLTHKHLVKGFLSALLAVSIYQTNILIVIIVSFTFIFIQSLESTQVDYKKLIISVLRTGLLSVLAAAVAILSYKIYEKTGNYVNPDKGTNVATNYLELIKNILGSIKYVYLRMYTLYPRYFIPIIVVVNWIIAMYAFVMKRERVVHWVIWTILIGILFTTPFAYMLASNSTWAVQRTLLPVFFSVAMFLSGTMFIVRNQKSLVNVLCVMSAIIVFVNWYYTQTCIVDAYMGQALDQSEVTCIQNEIEEYEETTGIEITKVSWKKSPEMTYVHPLLHFQDDNIYTHRIICDAGDYLLKYLAKEDYELLWMTDAEYEEYFDDSTWEVFNPSEQLHFEGDTLYWVVY